MDFFALIDFVKHATPAAQVVRVSMFATGVVSVAYRIGTADENTEHALHVWPNGQYAFRPADGRSLHDGQAVPSIAAYLASNAAELWLVRHVGQLQGLVLADNVRAAKRELDAVCRPWQEEEARGTRWPLAYALAVVQRVSGVRYGVKCLHLLADGSLVANLSGTRQVLLASGGVVMIRACGNRRQPWEKVELDGIAQQLNRLWHKRAHYTAKRWHNTLKR